VIEMWIVICLCYVAYKLLLPSARYLDEEAHK
jgi:hypothetical protein